ncbi:universal stress protein [Actinomadura scrupuli]|uniref:universal stress protein n=1 Tax=Actinomadura scrupuli TaxID=559629 RepID=UPI003D97E443
MVGIDGYHISWAALEYACEVAVARKALLNVVEIWPVPASLRDGAPSVLIRRALADAQQRLDQAVESCRERYPGLEISDRAVPGHPVGTLAERSGGADLLVVGARGRGTVAAPFAGSVGHGLAHHAKCPVAIVRSLPGGDADAAR